MTRLSPTPEQRRAIEVNEGAYLVIAPPGSGKTFVLTQRIIRLLQQSAGESFRILALTFTTKAAEEMRGRIEAEISDEWRRVLASTFHAFCLDVLQHYGDRVGVDQNSTIYESDADRLEVLARGLADDGYRVEGAQNQKQTLSSMLGEIGRLKRNLIPASAAPRDRIEGVSLAEAYTAYDRTLRLFGALDFDDLLLLTHGLLTEHPRVAEHYRRIFRYVLVDEAQDMSLAQYEVLSALLGKAHRNVMLVADADQSIYGFAGASHRFVDRFVQEFDADELPLKNSFRCGRYIAEAANRLIAHNPDRVDRPAAMQAAIDATGMIKGRSFQDEQGEARAVADWIEALLDRGMEPTWLVANETPVVDDQDICVLARSRYALRSTIGELESRKISHRFGTGEAGLFESELFQAALFSLRVLANPKDVMSRAKLLAVAGCPVDAQDDSFSQTRPTDFFELIERTRGEWSRFVSPFVKAARDELDVVDLIDGLTRSNLDWVTDADERDLSRLDQQVLAERWKVSAARSGYAERSLAGLLGELALAGRQILEGPGVRVLSIHAVKGLEFRVVVLVGMNEGIFPDFRAESNKDLEEERRNAYVAVTRASRALLITRPQTRITSYGNVRPQSESRFVSEMGLQMEHEAPSIS